jgi:hypothetical protein
MRLEYSEFKLHRENLVRYYALAKANSRKKLVYGSGEDKKEAWRLVNESVKYAIMRSIIRCSRALNVPAELIIDGEHYYRRCGFAGFRIPLEMYRKGLTYAELTFYDGISNSPNKHFVASWYRGWYYIIQGRLDMAINSVVLMNIIKLCWERLGLSLADLAVPPATARRLADSLVSGVSDMLATFDDVDCSFLFGTVKALHDYKFGSVKDLRSTIEELVDWYHGKQKIVRRGAGAP